LSSGRPTQAGCKQLGVEVRQELLVIRIELAHSCDDVAGQTDAYDLHDRLEDQQGEVRKVGVRGVLVLEHLHEAIAAVVERVRAHGDKVGRVEVDVAQAQGLWIGEERHVWIVKRQGSLVWVGRATGDGRHSSKQ
jgi:hypothetical protein